MHHDGRATVPKAMINRVPKSLIRYGITGVFINGLLYLVFIILLWSGLSPVMSAAIGYMLGVCGGYLMNRSWSFQSDQSHRQDLPKFLVSYAVGLVATMLFISLLTLFMPAEIAQLINIGLTALVIYLCLRITGFGGDQAKS